MTAIPQNKFSSNHIWKEQSIIDIVNKKCKSLSLILLLSIEKQKISFTVNFIIEYAGNKLNPVGLKIFILGIAHFLVVNSIRYQDAKT